MTSLYLYCLFAAIGLCLVRALPVRNERSLEENAAATVISEPTTAAATATVTVPATTAATEECPICDYLCMTGHVKDPDTGCDICGECINPPTVPGVEGDRGFGFGVRHDEGGDPGFGMEGGRDIGKRPRFVVPGLKHTEGARDCDIDCLDQYQPVCGKDKRTYSNACTVALEECRTGITIGIEGPGEC